MTGEAPGFLLDQYAAITCPVKTQNTFNPLLSCPQPVDSQVVEHFREISSHRVNVTDYLLEHHGALVSDLRHIQDPDEQVKACASAIAVGTPIILAAHLPPDWENHRCGTADILIKDMTADKPIYYPVIIKDRPVLNTSSVDEAGQLTSSLAHPFFDEADMSRDRLRTESQSDTLLQLAHLWLMLDAAGLTGDEAWGAVIGSDHEDKTHSCLICWINLNSKLIRAFSFTSAHQWKKYSPINRYLHEHRFRVHVATRALRQTGQPGDPDLVAAPIHIQQCDMCEWWPQCQSQLANDISVKIERSPLDAREIMTLRSLGISTINDLTSADIDALLPSYLPRVAHRPGAETRLRLAARRGHLIATGAQIERLTSGPIKLPSAPIEVDLDIETSSNNHVYLWGFLVHDRRDPDNQPTYHAVHRFTSLTSLKEMDLAEKAATWIKDLIDSAGDCPVLVWHYSTYELSALRRFANAHGPSTALAWLSNYAVNHFIDLFSIVRENFFGVDGLGLKAIANAGAGFTWRDPDPSGLNSQFWFVDSIRGATHEIREAARTRILEYNEDDVRATWALRQWIRTLT